MMTDDGRGCSGGGTLSQPSAPWVACSFEPERAEASPGTLSSPCRPCGGCSHGLRGLSKAMGDGDGIVTVKLPTVSHV